MALPASGNCGQVGWAGRSDAVRKSLLILLIAFFGTCIVSGSLSAAGPTPEKPQVAIQESGKNGKELPLYQYYQRYLTPYLAGLQTKTKGGSTEPERNPGTLTALSSGSLVSGKSKNQETGASQNALSPEQKTAEGINDKAFITLNKSESVGLAEMNKSFPKEFKKEYNTEFLVGYKVSPLVDILFGKAQKIERSQDSPWGVHDDGWRLKLQKTF